jgi:hypothetical protein
MRPRQRRTACGRLRSKKGFRWMIYCRCWESWKQKRSASGFTGDEWGRRAPETVVQQGFRGLCPSTNSPLNSTFPRFLGPPPRGIRDAVRTRGPLLEEEVKAFLRKVAVVREDLGDVVLSHHVHRDAVGKAVGLSGRCSYNVRPSRNDSRV